MEVGPWKDHMFCNGVGEKSPHARITFELSGDGKEGYNFVQPKGPVKNYGNMGPGSETLSPSKFPIPV